jgi:hypothetical protein
MSVRIDSGRCKRPAFSEDQRQAFTAPASPLRGAKLVLNRSYRPGGSSLFCCAKKCFEGCRRRPPTQPRSGVIVKPGARAPGARCQRNSRCSLGLKPQRGDMERLAARGWHNSVSPPLGLREVARTQIPGAHAPRLYDSAPLRGLGNQYQRQRNWDDPFSGASPTFHRPTPAVERAESFPFFHPAWVTAVGAGHRSSEQAWSWRPRSVRRRPWRGPAPRSRSRS